MTQPDETPFAQRAAVTRNQKDRQPMAMEAM